MLTAPAIPTPAAAPPVVIDGSPLTIDAYYAAASGRREICFSSDASVRDHIAAAARIVDDAVASGAPIYGITTGFGSLAGERVPPEDAAASQKNLLDFLAAGAGDFLDERHVRGAMVLRANVLARGCSGVRVELIERLIQFLRHGATPAVRALGSIGASGDLVPLSSIARAICGVSERSRIRWGDRLLSGPTLLRELGLEPLELKPKEGLALVNGTSFSAAVAANCVYETRGQFAVAMATQAMMLRALDVQREPFDPFVHQHKPHPGQLWVAETMRQLLRQPAAEKNGRTGSHPANGHDQDCYSVRCLPQYLGPLAENLRRVTRTVEIEMNAVSDNPLIDVESGRFCQSGNFLGHGLAMAMDDLRRVVGLTAKHLDVQIAALVSPAFSKGLPPSLRGNGDLPYNMGLKGLQITGNSIAPLLAYLGNPLVEHFPAHAEQYNQNINGLSWGAANMAWQSAGLFRHYLAVALVFAVQALDLRAALECDHFDGRSLLSPALAAVYEAVYAAMRVKAAPTQPFLRDDADHWLEERLESLAVDLSEQRRLARAVQPITDSLARLDASV